MNRKQILFKDTDKIMQAYYGTNGKFEYALASPPKGFVSVSKTEFTTCRETLMDEMPYENRNSYVKWNSYVKYNTPTFAETGYVWIALRVCCSSRDKLACNQTRKNFEADAQTSLKLVNLAEKRFRFPRTVMYPALIQSNKGKIIDNAPTVIFRVSKKWMRVPCVFSFFLLLLRASRINKMAGVEKYKDIFTAANDTLRNHKDIHSDAYYLVKVESVADGLLSNFKKFFGNGTIKEWWGSNPTYSGINALATAVLAIKEYKRTGKKEPDGYWGFPDIKLAMKVWEVTASG